MIHQADVSPTTVLLVEDEWMIRMIASDALAEEGCEIFEARHAAEAITILEQHHRDIHVVVTDVTMPGELDGVALAHHASVHWPWIGLLVVSAKPRNLHPPLPAQARFEDKPYQTATILRHIRELRAASS